MQATDLSREYVRSFEDGTSLFRCILPTGVKYSYIEDLTGFELGSRPTSEEDKLISWYERLVNSQWVDLTKNSKQVEAIIDDDTYNNLEWRAVGVLELLPLIKNMKVIAVQPCDYPNTDAVTLFLEGERGQRKAVDIVDADSFSVDEEREKAECIEILIADIPA